jgi:three-Cys-motif partner protein
MQAYLEPQDDGLPMRETGLWAAEKLDYLARYVDVFETAMRKKWHVRYYVDLLAGPGKNVVRDSGEVLLGSPLLSLTTTYSFTGYFFVDLSDENTKALQQRCAASPHSQRVDIRTGDCNDLVDDIVAHIRQEDWRSLNLAFLDPEGMELRWETVAKLATVQRMDLIINYPEGGLNRYMGRALETKGQTSVDDFFGDRAWRKIYQDCQNRGAILGIHRQLIDFYRERLQGLGYTEFRQVDQVGDEPLIRNVRRRAPLYRLLFASKHSLGHDFWHKVTRRDVHGQAHLPF